MGLELFGERYVLGQRRESSACGMFLEERIRRGDV